MWLNAWIGWRILSGENTSLIKEIEGLAVDVAKSEGLQLYDIEFVGRGRQRVLRVFIDKEGGGASIDDCANVSRGLNVVLDADDVIPGGAYDLEVSTPGLERKLSKTWHFDLAIGKTVQVRTNEFIPVPEGAQFKSPPRLKTIVGELISATDDEVVLKKDDLNWVINRNLLHKAKIVFVDPKFQEKAPKKKKKK